MLIRRLLPAVAASLLLGAVAAAPAAAQSQKIAVVNTSRVFKEMAETKAMSAKNLEEFTAMQKEGAGKVEAIKQLRAQRDNTKPDHPQYDDLNSKLVSASIELRVWEESRKAMMDAKQKRQTKALFDKIQKAVAEIAQKDGIELVLSDSDTLPEDIDQISPNQLRGAILAQSVIFASKNADITEKVLALLDAQFKAAAGVAPAP